MFKRRMGLRKYLKTLRTNHLKIVASKKARMAARAKKETLPSANMPKHKRKQKKK